MPFQLVFRRELLAIKEAVRHFKVEIAGRHLTVLTDHKVIVDALKTQNTQPFDPIASYNHIMEHSEFYIRYSLSTRGR